jgi:hypothetical protein
MIKTKFRAYCHKTNQIYTPIDRIEWLISSDIIRATAVISEIEEHHMHNDYGGRKNFEIDQFIGVRDINKREIYENDYVKVNLLDDSGNTITRFLAMVSYEEQLAAFTLSYIPTDDNSKDIRKRLWKSDSLLHDESDSIMEPIRIDPLSQLEYYGNYWLNDIDIIVKAYNRDAKIDEILNDPQ